MATSLAATTARRAAILARLSPTSSPASRAAVLIRRCGLAGAAKRHSPPKVPIWNWKVPSMNNDISLFVLGLSTILFSVSLDNYMKDEDEEKVAEPTK